jgi:uncharacterized protein (TIGR02444 family)
MSDLPSNPFWEFSLRVYGQENVPPACLRLQDRHGVDVNLLLYLCWLAAHRKDPLTEAEIDDAVRLTADWRDAVVRSLRRIRRRMKEGFESLPQDRVESLRSAVKRVELESERLQQAALFERNKEFVDENPALEMRRSNAMANTERYLRMIGVTIEDADRMDCETIVATAFSEENETLISEG